MVFAKEAKGPLLFCGNGKINFQGSAKIQLNEKSITNYGFVGLAFHGKRAAGKRDGFR